MHSATLSFAVEQMDKGQDYVCSGAGTDVLTGESFQWMMLTDGHGTHSCIEFIRSIPTEKKSELLGQAEPVQAMAEFIDASGSVGLWEETGSTVVIVKIYADRAVGISSGDSQFIAFKNDHLEHVSPEHNCKNEAERTRIAGRIRGYEASSNIQIVEETVLAPMVSEYALFKPIGKLASTQALGHNSRTGYAPHVHVVSFEPGSKYRFVLGSDGLFDMMMLSHQPDVEKLASLSSQGICDWTVARWLQLWTARIPDKPDQAFRYQKKNCDDVSVGVIDIEPM
jgi:serine/threonine protein phosphatase PrpC